MLPHLLPEYDRVDAKRRQLFSIRPLPPEPVARVKRAQDLAWLHACHHWGGGTMRAADIDTVTTTGMAVAGHAVAEHVEISNLADALEWVESWAQANVPLRPRDLRHLHAVLTTGLPGANPGRFRTSELRIAGEADDPSPGQAIPRRIQAVCTQVNGRQRQHPIARAVGAGAAVLTIRPFNEGNDLTASLLVNGLLLQRSYPIAVLDDHKGLHGAQQAARIGDVRPLERLVTAAVADGFDRYLAALR
jgi:hypothetical protein